MKFSSVFSKAGATLVAMLIVLAPATIARAASGIVVDDNRDPKSCRATATFTTIQAAINSVPAGGDVTIKVCPGTYAEKLSISQKGKVTLQGVKMPVISSPTGWDTLTVISSGPTTIKGLAINTNRGGIFFSDTEGSISGVTVTGIAGSPYGIFVMGDGIVKITGNKVIGTNYPVYIQGTTNSITISKNTLTAIVNAGIRLEGVSRATISGNTITGGDFSQGVFGRDVTNLTVSANKMQVQYGVVVLEECNRRNPHPTESLLISKNKITMLANGQTAKAIQIHSIVLPDSACNPVISGVKISGNTLVGTPQSIGFEMVAMERIGMPTVLPGIVNAVIAGNTLKQFGAPFSIVDSPYITGTTTSKNKCDGAACP